MTAARNNSAPTRKFMLLYEILKKSSTDNQLISVIHFVLSLGQSNFSLSFLNAYKHLISFFRFPQSLSRLLPQCPWLTHNATEETLRERRRSHSCEAFLFSYA